MTNSTQLVSFKKLCYGAQFKYSADDAAEWVKIGHNTVAGWNPKYVSDSWTGQPICAFAEDDQIDADVFLVTPAPAEDVRAVVEEPVAYLTNGGKTFYFPSPNIERHPGDIPLYRHPQRPVVPAIDFNEEILLQCPAGVRVGFCGDVKLSFDGAEYRGRAWLMEQGGKEEWVAIEGPENCRKAGEALIAWAEAWEGKSDE